MRSILIAASSAALLAACANFSSSNDATASSANAAPTSGAPVPVNASTGTEAAIRSNAVASKPSKVDPDPADLARYKVLVAGRIASSNDHGVKTQAPRPADERIKGLTVVGLQVRSDGSAEKLWVVRSSGDAALDRQAVDSVQKSLPLPLPTDDVLLGRTYTIFAESWIHRTDGKFQLVSLTTRESAAGGESKSPVQRASAKSAAK